MSTFFDQFIPKLATPPEKMRAKVLVAVCFAVSGAISVMLLYWIIFSWLEQWETVVLGLIFIALLAGLVELIKRGWVRPVAWTLTLFLLALNLVNMAGYGVGSTASAGFVLVIVLAAFTLGPWLGLGSAVLGSAAVFGIALAGSAGILQTEIPFQQSNLSFDAMMMTLVYLLVGLMCAVGIKALEKQYATG